MSAPNPKTVNPDDYTEASTKTGIDERPIYTLSQAVAKFLFYDDSDDHRIPGQAVEEVLMNAKAMGYGPGSGGDPGYTVTQTDEVYAEEQTVTVTEGSRGNVAFFNAKYESLDRYAVDTPVIVTFDGVDLSGVVRNDQDQWGILFPDLEDCPIVFIISYNGQSACFFNEDAVEPGSEHILKIMCHTETIEVSEGFKKAVKSQAQLHVLRIAYYKAQWRVPAGDTYSLGDLIFKNADTGEVLSNFNSDDYDFIALESIAAPYGAKVWYFGLDNGGTLNMQFNMENSWNAPDDETCVGTAIAVKLGQLPGGDENDDDVLH